MTVKSDSSYGKILFRAKKNIPIAPERKETQKKQIDIIILI